MNRRYGSSTPRVTRSSMSTPMYELSRPRVTPGRPSVARPAFNPAMAPCPAASSYPVVPLICPAKNKPDSARTCSVASSCVGG